MKCDNNKGKKIVDFKENNLHVLNYSIPINKKIKFKELKNHLFTLPTHPDWIPYKTSYYQPNWGFCLTQNQYNNIFSNDDEEFHVVISSFLSR